MAASSEHEQAEGGLGLDDTAEATTVVSSSGNGNAEEGIPHFHIGDPSPSSAVPAFTPSRMVETPPSRAPNLVVPPSPFWEAFGGMTPREPYMSARMQNDPRELSGLSATARHIDYPGWDTNDHSDYQETMGLDSGNMIGPGLSLESHRLLAKAKTANEFMEQSAADKANFDTDPVETDQFRFTRVLLLSAAISSALSFAIDFVGMHMGALRGWMLATGAHGWVLTSTFNVIAVVCARLLIRKNNCPQAEGSGMPEVKTMLFGQVEEVKAFLTMKVLVIKTTALALLVGAGLPIGKEGPFVHLASCITAILEPMLLERGSKTAFSLLLASVAVGVGTTFSGPLGGVLFALELMLPQIYDKETYLSCFQASVIGSVIYCCLRTWSAGGTAGLLPLLSTDVLPGEGVPRTGHYLNIAIHVVLGVFCGIGAALFIKFHRFTFFRLKSWRLRGKGLPPPPVVSSSPDRRGRPTLAGPRFQFYGGSESGKTWAQDDFKRQVSPTQSRWSRFCSCCNCCDWEWRDIFQMAVVILINSRVTAFLPILAGLGGEPPTQPALLSKLFSKGLHASSDTWDLGIGKAPMMMVCLVFKFCITGTALSLPSPGGIVAPTMILGAFTSRVIAYLFIPEWLVDYILDPGNGTAVTADERGAFYARLTIVGAAAFCAGVARAFAMCITVFEVLALPNSVIPLSVASLTSIFVANKIHVGFFDQILINKELLGVAAMTEKSGTNVPAHKVMRRYLGDLERKCLPTKACLGDVQQLLQDTAKSEEFFPIVQHSRGFPEPLLVATISRKSMEQVLLNCRGSPRETMVDFLDLGDFQEDPRAYLVNRAPLHVDLQTAVQHVFLMMKVMAPYTDPLVFVTSNGRLLGIITDKELLAKGKK